MNKNPTTNENFWDVVPPNTPLMMDWPALEKTPEVPLKSKETNKTKKAKSQKKVDIISPKEIQSIPDLDQSLLVTPQEHEKLMQLSSMFDKLELSAIISVLRGVNGNMTKAIDQCLILNDELEKYEAQMSKSAQESSEDESKVFSLKDSKEEEDNKSQIFSLGDSDLEGFEELGEEEDEDVDIEIPDVEELEDWSESSLKTSSFEDDKKSLNSETEEEEEEEQEQEEEQEAATSSKQTDTYTVLGEYIELPIVPTQDSEVEKWLKEFDSSYSLRRTKSAESSTELDSLGESSPLLDSSMVSVNTAPALGDSNGFKSLIPSLESIPDIDLQLMSSPKMSPRTYQDLKLSLEPGSKPALEPIVRNTSSFSLEPTKGVSLAEIFLEAKPFTPIVPITRSASEPPVEDRPYFFAEDDSKSLKEGSQKKMVERRQNAMLKRQEKRLLRQRAKLSRRLSTISKDVGTLTINQPIASVGIEPKEQPETVTLQFHQEKVTQLEAAKIQVEEEKKRAMTWCIGQIQQAYEENKEKTATIEAQKEEIEQLKKQIEEMKSNEGKLHNLFTTSKEILVEGVQSLQKNISEGFAKVEKDWVILEKVKEMDVIEKVKDLDLLEKVKKLASSFKEEISFAFSNLEASVQKVTTSSREQLSHEEEGELWKVEKASLESYIQELEERIKTLQSVKEKPQEKETQVERIETQMQGTNTVSPSIASESSQTGGSSFENEYSNSYRFYQQQYRQQWEQLHEKPKFYDSD